MFQWVLNTLLKNNFTALSNNPSKITMTLPQFTKPLYNTGPGYIILFRNLSILLLLGFFNACINISLNFGTGIVLKKSANLPWLRAKDYLGYFRL